MSRTGFWLLFALLATASFTAAMLPNAWQSTLKGHIIGTIAPAQSSAEHVRAGLFNISGRLNSVFPSDSQQARLAAKQKEINILRQKLVIQQRRTIEEQRKNVGLTNFQKFTAEHYGQKLGIIPARVIARDATNLNGVIIIDKGTSHGVREGAGVVWGYAAVGVVTVAKSKASQVYLLTNPACKIPAYIQRTGESTMVSGNSVDSIKMHHIFREKVVPGDKCLTSGDLSMFPRDIVIGAVTEASLPGGELFWDITIKPELNLSALQTVIVLVPEKREL